MAKRKKKQKESIKTSDSIGYTGTITVSLRKDKKIISTKTFKNHGRWPLFYFIAQCLKGDYANADTFRPKYINLFCLGKKGQDIPIELLPSNPDVSDFSILDLEHKLSLNAYPYSSAPEVSKVESKGYGSAKITYKFTIPFTQIDLSDPDKKDINGIALYSPEFVSSNLIQASAFFMVTQGAKNDKLGSLLTTEESELSNKNDYNIYLVWEMEFKNN